MMIIEGTYFRFKPTLLDQDLGDEISPKFIYFKGLLF
jgi:hypothetical protein